MRELEREREKKKSAELYREKERMEKVGKERERMREKEGETGRRGGGMEASNKGRNELEDKRNEQRKIFEVKEDTCIKGKSDARTDRTRLKKKEGN